MSKKMLVRVIKTTCLRVQRNILGKKLKQFLNLEVFWTLSEIFTARLSKLQSAHQTNNLGNQLKTFTFFFRISSKKCSSGIVKTEFYVSRRKFFCQKNTHSEDRTRIIDITDYGDKSPRQQKKKTNFNCHQTNLKKPLIHPKTLQNQLKFFSNSQKTSKNQIQNLQPKFQCKITKNFQKKF